MSKIKLLLWLVGGLVCNLQLIPSAYSFTNKPGNNLLFPTAYFMHLFLKISRATIYFFSQHFFLTKDYNLCHLVVLLYGPMRRELGLCYTVRLPKAAQCSFINSPLHRCSRKSFVNTINRK